MSISNYHQSHQPMQKFRDELMERLFGDYNRNQQDNSNVSTSQWIPPVDILEDRDAYILRADLPGVRAKDIHVAMENNMLTIRGERVQEKKESCEGCLREERVVGTFYRRFTLPDTVDGDRINARSENGVLEIRIPKAEKTKPRKIEVRE